MCNMDAAFSTRVEQVFHRDDYVIRQRGLARAQAAAQVSDFVVVQFFDQPVNQRVGIYIALALFR